MDDLIIDDKWKKIIHIIQNTNKNLIIHWKAWTGKSSLLKYLREVIVWKKLYFTWSSGISALNIEWVTLHSAMGINHKNEVMWLSEKKIKKIKDADVIVIDEKSMVRADVYDMVNWMLSYVMWNWELYWGKQIVLVWDMYQLWPVVNKKLEPNFYKKYETAYYFSAQTFDRDDFEYVELMDIHRQKDDKEYWNILSHIRVWRATQSMIDKLNTRLVKYEDINPHSILIATKNDRVNKINEKKLLELPWLESIFQAEIKWDYPRDIYPAEEFLKLKVWCRALILSNGETYANWELWTITHLSSDKILLLKDTGTTVEINRKITEITEKLTEQEIDDIRTGVIPMSSDIRITWEWEWEIWERVIASFEQFPIALWYAITVHKSQWKTFENIVVDLWYDEYMSWQRFWTFCDWQLYVVLSRCKTLKWVELITPIKLSDVKVNKILHLFIMYFRNRELEREKKWIVV